MANRYYNSTAYPFVKGDRKPSYTFSIYNYTGGPANLSSYPSLIVHARFREQGSSTSLANITCTAVNAAIGQYRIDTWPTTVAAASEGIHELEIEVDFNGDGTVTQTVYHLIKFNVLEQFGATS